MHGKIIESMLPHRKESKVITYVDPRVRGWIGRKLHVRKKLEDQRKEIACTYIGKKCMYVQNKAYGWSP